MDPDQTLKGIREAMFLLATAPHDRAALDHADELADLVEALDQWLSKGGFLPEAWQR